MPLDNRKSAHIQSTVAKTFAGRQKVVVFVYQSGSSYTYTATSVIFRPQSAVDPQVPTVSGTPPGLQFDAILMAPLGTSFTGLLFVADTTTASAAAVQAAAKYEVVQAVPVGIVPGGTRIQVWLRRLR